MKTFTIRETASEGIEFNFRRGGICGVPIGQGLLRLIQTERTTLHRVDVAKARLIQEENAGDGRALLLIQTAPGVGGVMWLSSNDSVSRIDEQSGHIVRDVLPITENTGVQILSMGPNEGVEGGTEFLVTALPGASFRIRRTGGLFGAASELVVRWHGNNRLTVYGRKHHD